MLWWWWWRFQCAILQFSGILLLITTTRPTWAWISCPPDLGGGICPNDNICCPTNTTGMSACITGGKKNNNLHLEQSVGGGGGCCNRAGGCGRNYTCGMDIFGHDICEMTPGTDTDGPPILPRYKPCILPAQAFQQVYGLKIPFTTTPTTKKVPVAAYFSSLGSLTTRDPELLRQQAEVQTIVISIHGSERTADDYLCATQAALPPETNQNRFMVLAPWFLAPQDGPIDIHDEDWEFKSNPVIVPLRWLETNDMECHAWRYGADSLKPFSISSFTVLDSLLDVLWESRSTRFPQLQRILVTGHSAGGQYTHRWALLSNHFLFATNMDFRVVVANPRSFCYLDAQRYITSMQGYAQWQIPSTLETWPCPLYNHWPWGWDNQTAQREYFFETPYKDVAISLAGGLKALIQRYAHRSVVYLSGQLDVETNGYCMDLFQGIFRRERSRRYFLYLQNYFSTQLAQYRIEVPGVHHDHSLLYQSPEGQVALFGNSSEVLHLQKRQMEGVENVAPTTNSAQQQSSVL